MRDRISAASLSVPQQQNAFPSVIFRLIRVGICEDRVIESEITVLKHEREERDLLVTQLCIVVIGVERFSVVASAVVNS